MRVLVTGAAGFIGSHLCETLLGEGHDVVGLDCFTPYYAREIKQRNLHCSLHHHRFEFIERDLRCGRLEALLASVQAVIHAAAMPGLPRSWSEFDRYVSCNLTATQRLLEASKVAGIEKFVHISTSSVYGAVAVGDETQPTNPVSPYGITKLAAEHLVRSYVEAFEFPAIILRYFSIYGPRQRPDMAYQIFIERMLRGESITVFGDGQQSRSNTYVADCVCGTVQALHSAVIGEIYNLGGGEVVTLASAIDMIANIVGVQPIIEYRPVRVGDQRRTQADFSKARRHFGYAPATAPAEGLAQQVDWQRSLAR